MKRIPLYLALLALPPVSHADPVSLTLHGGKKGVDVARGMHGLFFEDINYAADGGLYAELIENRSFEHRDGMHAWSVDGKSSLTGENPIHPHNPRFLRLKLPASVTNTGFSGIPLKEGAEYRFSVHARKASGDSGNEKLTVRLKSPDGKTLAESTVGPLTGDWKKHQVMLRSAATEPNAKLTVSTEGKGNVDLDMVSLFPKDTFKGRKNGMRADLAQMLADIKPGFMRFPGGCIVEGKDLANAYRWKETVGPVEHRKQNWNRWQNALDDRTAEQYYQTYGLGFFEYFQLCEDIGCEAIPVINCGMSCQFQDKEFVPVSDLAPWVQDALDLVEFANGPVTSKWGKLRADMGHPEPFGMKRLGIGNEQWGEEFFERYEVFAKALRVQCPDIKLISTTGPGVDDPNWRLAWDKFKSGTPVDIVDEHYYRPPAWFLANHARYDTYDRSAPKVFAGEFAAHEPNRTNTLRAALSEASGMTGMVRNADVVTMTAYAPLFAKYGFTQWSPDLIWFDNSSVHATPSYHVQAMFSQSLPDVTVPLTLTDSGAEVPAGRIGLGTWKTTAEFRNIVLKQGGKITRLATASDGLEGALKQEGQWSNVGGIVKQAELGENCRLLLGSEFTGDFTLSLEGQKTGGKEGFLILFEATPNSEACWWNIGGQGNTGHGIEAAGVKTPIVPGKIDNNHWYKIRIESKGDSIRCFLDGKMIHDTQRNRPQRIYASAGLDKSASEVIIQAVNPTDQAVEADIKLESIKPAADARIAVLTSERLDDINTLENPDKVVPKEETISISGPTFRHTLPARSLSIMRIPTH